MTSEEFRDYLDWLATPEARTSKVRWTPELADDNQQLEIADERPRLSAFEIRDACLELRDEVHRAFPQRPQRPQLTLIQGGRDA